MRMKNLIKSWSLPDRSADRTQITLRISYTDYARLHALKEVYPKRSVNDILCDIIKEGLDEVVESLPSWVMDEREAAEIAGSDQWLYDELRGSKTGPAVQFDIAFQRILDEKPNSESEAAA